MRHEKTNAKQKRSWWRRRKAVGLTVAITLAMALLFSGTALAAEVVSGDPYILPRGEVVNDDLYVSGSEVIIDGTIEGDLIATGGYVEVNGVVMGDLLAAGGAVVIAGAIQDDVRAAGGAVILNGSVGDDLFAAAGGGLPGGINIPMGAFPGGNRNVPQGLQLNTGSTIAGDAYLAGGQGVVAGSIGRNLVAALGNLTVSGKVAGDANLNAQSLTVQDSALVQGQLSYSTSGNTVIPGGIAGSVVKEDVDANAPVVASNPVGNFFRWLLQTVLLVAGYLIAGWLLWTFAPRQVVGSVVMLEARPMEAGVTGLLLAVAVLPVGAALTFVAGLFFGFFPGGISVAAFIFGLAALFWLLSPLITGLWVGRKISKMTGVADSELARLLLGIAVIVLVGRLLTVIPCIGDLTFQVIYLASFALAAGSWFLANRRPPQEPALLPAPIVPAI